MAYGGEDHEADEHPDSACDEGFAPAEVLDYVEATEGGAEVDAAEDHLGNVGVADAGAVEDDGSLEEGEKQVSLLGLVQDLAEIKESQKIGIGKNSHSRRSSWHR